MQRPTVSWASWHAAGVDFSVFSPAAHAHLPPGGMAHTPPSAVSVRADMHDHDLQVAFLSNQYDANVAEGPCDPSPSSYGQSGLSIFSTNRRALLYEPLPDFQAAPDPFQDRIYGMGFTNPHNPILPSAYPPPSEHYGIATSHPSQPLPSFPNPSSEPPATPYTASTPSQPIAPAFPLAPTALGRERKLRSRILKLTGARPDTPKPEVFGIGNWRIRCPVEGCGHVQYSKRVGDMKRHLDRHFSKTYLCGIPVSELDEEEFVQAYEFGVRHCDKLGLDYVGGCGKLFGSEKALAAHIETNPVCYEQPRV
ncbi:hypothetical protein GY45DRAFT_1316404 [Cubamyces sp. BRFM 1775]|nr:hypothetical protein GY45DRAFT_1316404 [Cubamyces sp. BRFM 1775]